MGLGDKEFLKTYDGPALRIMEVCGTHTAAIFKSGIRSFLSPKIRLISGPGCPVCVTMTDFIDQCIEAAMRPGHELLCFGDLLKVPGGRVGRVALAPESHTAGRVALAPESHTADRVALAPESHVNRPLLTQARTLSDAKSTGARVRMIWSPFDAIDLAKSDPGTIFVVAAIGFETTAPAFGLLIGEAEALGIKNIKLLTSLKSAIAAIDWVCADSESTGRAGAECGLKEPSQLSDPSSSGADSEAIDAFLCPGHVSVITGADAYRPLAEKYKKPFIVAGFEGERLLGAIRAAAEDAAEGRGGVRNFYHEAVSPGGNEKARAITERYFEQGPADWRGLGSVAASGYHIKEDYRKYDAGTPAHNTPAAEPDPDGCRCGEVILGRINPDACPLFGTACTPAHAIGPCMVSSEGACGIWYTY